MRIFYLLFAGLFWCPNPTAAQELRVMSYNIRYDNPGDGADRWDLRKEQLAAQVAHYAPDIMGTQEGLAHQLDYLDSALTEYAFVGVGRDSGGREGEFSALFYRTGKLELEDQGTFWLSETPGKPSKGWDAALNRICTYGRFKARDSGIRFWVFNTHFDHVGARAREESVRLILREIAGRNSEGLPVILVGDLNLEPESAPIRLLSETLDDAYTRAGGKAYGPAGTFNGFDCATPADRRIDYVFTGPGDFRITGFTTLAEFTGTGFPSDHFPVMADLEFNPE